MYSNELICNILNYIDNNLFSNINIDLISRTFCYDKFYIIKKFKKEIGISIFNYINTMKINNCIKYFNSSKNVTSIFFKSGFNSLEYFSETFKNIMGVNPYTFKKYILLKPNISDNDVIIIKNSIGKISELKNKVEKYKSNLKPKKDPIKKLSIFK